MIEGLRLLPWLQEAARRDETAVAHLMDCETCMQTFPSQARQKLGCGFVPPPADLRGVAPWCPSGLKGARPTVCAGYAAKLPEVGEVARARFHWDKGSLGHFCDGEQPTEHLMRGIETLSSAVAEASEYYMTPASKGGGAEG